MSISDVSEELPLQNDNFVPNRSLTVIEIIQKACTVLLGLVVLFFIVLGIIAFIIEGIPNSQKSHENLIFVITDGTGPASFTLARVCSGIHEMAMDEWLIGTAKTYSANSYVTDSAAAATALACGVKTNNLEIGVNNQSQVVPNIMEAAKLAGYRTALVVTSIFNHATPAGFSAHTTSRHAYTFIADQQIQKNIDIIFGGGRSYLTHNNNQLKKKAESLGYTILTDAKELRSDNYTLPVIGLFSDSHIDYEIDRDNNVQPSLKEMVEKALNLLEGTGEKFFIMVEASRIDHSAHDNDVAAHYHEFMSYNEAFMSIKQFIKKRTDTLLIATSDHETGGLTLGRDGKYEWNPDVVKQISHSIHWMVNNIDLTTATKQDVASFVQLHTGIDMTKYSNEIETIVNGTNKVNDFVKFLRDVTSLEAMIHWSSTGHTGVDVNVYSYGHGKEYFYGNLDNIDIAHRLVTLFRFDMDAAYEKIKDFDPTAPSKLAEPIHERAYIHRH